MIARGHEAEGDSGCRPATDTVPSYLHAAVEAERPMSALVGFLLTGSRVGFGLYRANTSRSRRGGLFLVGLCEILIGA
jgi:hypothetical protein